MKRTIALSGMTLYRFLMQNTTLPDDVEIKDARYYTDENVVELVVEYDTSEEEARNEVPTGWY